jgi:hypothetical protein
MARFRRWYGAGPLHLLALAGCFALAAYAAIRLFAYEPLRVAIWFVGAAVVHDLVLFPLYSSADRAAQETAADVSRGPAAPGVNYVRFPAFLSLLLFLVWLPAILGLVDYFDASTGLDGSVFLPRWLLITAALFAGSAVVWAVHRFIRGRARHRREPGG